MSERDIRQEFAANDFEARLAQSPTLIPLSMEVDFAGITPLEPCTEYRHIVNDANRAINDDGTLEKQTTDLYDQRLKLIDESFSTGEASLLRETVSRIAYLRRQVLRTDLPVSTIEVSRRQLDALVDTPAYQQRLVCLSRLEQLDKAAQALRAAASEEATLEIVDHFNAHCTKSGPLVCRQLTSNQPDTETPK